MCCFFACLKNKRITNDLEKEFNTWELKQFATSGRSNVSQCCQGPGFPNVLGHMQEEFENCLNIEVMWWKVIQLQRFKGNYLIIIYFPGCHDMISSPVKMKGSSSCSQNLIWVISCLQNARVVQGWHDRKVNRHSEVCLCSKSWVQLSKCLYFWCFMERSNNNNNNNKKTTLNVCNN